MGLPRADRLAEPPVVGRWYIVPAILWARYSLSPLRENPNSKWWPVWGRKHNDIEFFNFEPLHYHVDPRFMTKLHWREIGEPATRTPLQAIQAHPISHVDLKDGPPRPTLRRMKCTLAHVEWGFATSDPVLKLKSEYAGRPCSHSKLGWVCPHRLFPLGSIAPVDGVITCPLHGLRIDASTGICLPAPNAKAGEAA